jgi:hypothetical protein
MPPAVCTHSAILSWIVLIQKGFLAREGERERDGVQFAHVLKQTNDFSTDT